MHKLFQPYMAVFVFSCNQLTHNSLLVFTHCRGVNGSDDCRRQPPETGEAHSPYGWWERGGGGATRALRDKIVTNV